MRKFIVAVTFVGCFFLFTANASTAKIKISDSVYLDIHGCVQNWLSISINKKGEEPNLITDFYLRRIRLLFKGQITPRINFLIGTLNTDMGKNGDMSARTLIVDAWIEYVISDYLKINAGLLKLPFSRHMQQSGSKLHGLDFHNTFLQRFGGLGHRDMGVMARGLLLKKCIDYRIAILDGNEYSKTVIPDDSDAIPPVPDVIQVTNKNDNLRMVGRIGYNVFDAEPGYFWAGTYFSSRLKT
jgi:hypothetical protein